MLNFICTTETLEALAKLDFTEEDDHLVELSVDLIELPYWFVFVSDRQSWTLHSYRRTQNWDYNDYVILDLFDTRLVGDKETGGGKGSIVDKELVKDAMLYFCGIRKLGSFVIENHLEEEFEPLDICKSSILFSVEDGKFTYKLVTGKERPDIMCTEQFDHSVRSMTRPRSWSDGDSDKA